MDEDDDLIARLAAGDEGALRELFSRHAPWLAVRLRTALPAADVEDVLQETFLALWRGASGYRPQGSAGGWIWGVARRQAALWLRRRGRDATLFAAEAEPEGPAPGDPVEAAVARMDLDAAVRTLGPEREVWRLVYEEDRPVSQVAALIGVPEGTVKSRAHRARRLLRAALLGRPSHGPASDGGA
jgi:RNA polymerase sigma-70 factor (ECF subfamily)